MLITRAGRPEVEVNYGVGSTREHHQAPHARASAPPGGPSVPAPRSNVVSEPPSRSSSRCRGSASVRSRRQCRSSPRRSSRRSSAPDSASGSLTTPSCSSWARSSRAHVGVARVPRWEHRASTWASHELRAATTLSPSDPLRLRASSGRSLLRSTFPDCGHGGHGAFTFHHP